MRSARVRLSTIGLYLTPALSVLAAVLITLFGRDLRTAAARVYGGPAGPDDVLAWRVSVVERHRGFYEPARHRALHVTVERQGASTSLPGRSDDQGNWEARIQVPAGTATEVNVFIQDATRVLAKGTVPLVPPSWATSFQTLPVVVAGHGRGDIELKASLARGMAAAAFPAELLIDARTHNEPAAFALVRASGEGAELPSAPLHTDSQGRARLPLTPTHHAPRVELHASLPSGAAGWLEAPVPVVAGAMWIDPEAASQGVLSVVSPVANRVAYVTVFSSRARLFGASVPLDRDPAGNWHGSVALPVLPDEPLWALASPDEPGQGHEESLVAWPLLHHPEPAPAARIKTPLLLDGMPEALSVVRRNALMKRMWVMVALAAGALIEAALLLWRAARAGRELEELLASQADLQEALVQRIAGSPGYWLKLVAACLVVALGFGAVAFVTWLKV